MEKITKVLLLILTLNCILVKASHAGEQAPTKSPELNQLDLEHCKQNAEILGYLTVINNSCKYEMNQGWSKFISNTSKSCIQKYGNSTMYNTTIASVHEAKNDIEKHGRNEVCNQTYKLYEVFY